MKEGLPVKLVTLRGECLEVVFQRKEIAQNRDGVVYLFHLNDLTDKKRGQRLVSFFRFGPEQLYAPNYGAVVETVLLNTIRRAFDSGRLTFDGPYDPRTYTEVPLQQADFMPPTAASGEEIQNLIKHEAYWLGFRYNPNPGYPNQFDSPMDLEYLGVAPSDVKRYVLLFAQRGLLEKIMDGLGRPTAKLIDSYELLLQRDTNMHTESPERWDVFISHAHEDKNEIARPLAEALKARGLRVWYDEFSLTVGDSLRKKIDRGLANSRFGVVILSKHFFDKHWPEQELNGLATREVGNEKVILPVWHGVGFDEVRQYSATLADRLAVKTEGGFDNVVGRLLDAIAEPSSIQQHVHSGSQGQEANRLRRSIQDELSGFAQSGALLRQAWVKQSR